MLRVMEGNFLKQTLPSLWCWPEMQNLNLLRAEVDQGRLGHSHVKPTTVATNSRGLYESLHNLVVKPGDRWVVADDASWVYPMPFSSLGGIGFQGQAVAGVIHGSASGRAR